MEEIKIPAMIFQVDPMVGLWAFIQVIQFDMAEAISLQVFSFLINIYLEEFGSIDAKDFGFKIFGKGRRLILFLKVFGNLKKLRDHRFCQRSLVPGHLGIKMPR